MSGSTVCHALNTLWLQIKFWLFSFVPVLFSLIFIIPALCILWTIEQTSVGISHWSFFFNSSSVDGFCIDQYSGAVFKGADILVSSMTAESFVHGYFFSLYAPYRRRASIRFFIAMTIVIVLVAVTVQVRPWNEAIRPEASVACFFFGFLLPDIIRSLWWLSPRKTLKISLVSIRSTLVQVLAGSLALTFMVLSLRNNLPIFIEMAVLGAIYPTITVVTRFLLRSAVTKVAAGKRGSMRELSLKIRDLTNEDFVALFVVPGLVIIFLLDDRSKFLTALSMQMLIEPIGALCFTKFVRTFPNWKAPRFARVHDARTLNLSPSKKIIFEKDEELQNVRWNGLVASEELGEKRAVLLGALFAFAIKKDVEEFLLRLTFGVVAETISDLLKLSIYERSGLIKEEISISRSLRDFVSGGVSTAFTFFTCLTGLFLFCWAGNSD